MMRAASIAKMPKVKLLEDVSTNPVNVASVATIAGR